MNKTKAMIISSAILASLSDSSSARQDNVVRGRRGGKNLKVSKPFGHSPRIPSMTQLHDEKFMSASQKRAHRAGEEIWV